MPNPNDRLADGSFAKRNLLQMQVNADICQLCKRVRKTRPHTSRGIRARLCDECRSKL